MNAAALWAVARRDLLCALRHRADLMTTLIFFVIVVSLFPLGVGSETALLRLMGPGVVWVAALLASMLALTRLFAGDYTDGTLEQLALAPQPLTLLVLAKTAAHWVVSGLPLVVIAPLLGLQFDLNADALLILNPGNGRQCLPRLVPDRGSRAAIFGPHPAPGLGGDADFVEPDGYRRDFEAILQGLVPAEIDDG